MAVKLKKISRKNPQNLSRAKWYLSQEKAGTVSMQEIAQEIEGRSALSRGDVQSVLSNLGEVLPLFLKLGQTIKLERFGSFRVSITSTGMDKQEELTSRQVKRVKIIFLPSVELKRAMRTIAFEIG
jgi:predicted histone-like DNA-binding protein